MSTAVSDANATSEGIPERSQVVQRAQVPLVPACVSACLFSTAAVTDRVTMFNGVLCSLFSCSLCMITASTSIAIDCGRASKFLRPRNHELTASPPDHVCVCAEACCFCFFVVVGGRGLFRSNFVAFLCFRGSAWFILTTTKHGFLLKHKPHRHTC